MARDLGWSPRTIDSHPKKREKRRRGWASFKNKSPKALAWRHTPTHAGAQRARPGATGGTTRAEGFAAASDRNGQRERPTGGTNTAKGVAGGLHDVARNEPLRKAGTPSDRPTNHLRASDGAMPATARNEPAGSVTERSFAG